ARPTISSLLLPLLSVSAAVGVVSGARGPVVGPGVWGIGGVLPGGVVPGVVSGGMPGGVGGVGVVGDAGRPVGGGDPGGPGLAPGSGAGGLGVSSGKRALMSLINSAGVNGNLDARSSARFTFFKKSSARQVSVVTLAPG